MTNHHLKWFQELMYRSGDIFLPSTIVSYLDKTLLGHSNTYYVNGWSFLHYLSGVVLGYIYLSLKFPLDEYYYKLIIIHTMWELWQMLIGMANPFQWKGGSGLADTILDTFFFMVGTYTIKNVRNK